MRWPILDAWSDPVGIDTPWPQWLYPTSLPLGGRPRLVARYRMSEPSPMDTTETAREWREEMGRLRLG